jgi:hypothetical protein
MCGIIGMISRRPQGFSYKDMDLYETMLVINTIRGKDSTGVFTRFRNGDVRVIKHGSNPFNMFRTNEWRDFKQQVIQRGKFVIGHNRAATRGIVNTDNAHPFVEDNIILVHNGTLRDESNLTSEKTDVDSHAIAHAFKGKSYAEVLPEINGAFALVWYDTNTDRLYATRNEERPLNLVVSEGIYFLSSEAWVAGIPAARDGTKVLENIEIKAGEIFVFEPDGKYTIEKWDINAIKKKVEDEGYDAWKSHVRRTMGVEAEEVTAPFDTGTETPEIKDLRAALTTRATGSFTTMNSATKHGNNCALTLVTASPSNADEAQAESKMVSVARINESFPRDLMVLIKIMSMSRMPNNRFKFNGIVYNPELERVDVQGFLPMEVDTKDMVSWLDTQVVAKVQFTTYTTNGGWTIHVKDVKKATFTQVHGKDIPIMLWDFARNHCQCGKCGRNVDSWEKVFTGVKLGGLVTKHDKPLNTVIVTCPDCIVQSIEKEDYRVGFESKYKYAKEAITKARTAAANRRIAVQDGKPVSQVIIPADGRIAQLQSKETLH